jgi:hypothetical protein
MPTTTYKVAPASPIPASSLLGDELSLSSDQTKPDADSKQSNEWDLRLDIENGLFPTSASSSEHNIFRPGTVIGFSRLRGRSPDGNEDEFVGEVSIITLIL